MATWHQQKAGLSEVYRPDPTKFKLIENPPNDLCTVGTYDSKEAAQAYIDRRVNVYKNGRRENFTIIPPKA